MKSWQIGAIAGLIAGIIAGIVYSIFIKLAVSIGFYDPSWRPIFENSFETNIILPIIWGMFFGIIYSKTRSLIPGKGASRDLFFGLILVLIIWIRHATFSLAYGWYLNAIGLFFTGFFKWIAFGLVLGLLYDFLCNRYYPKKKELKIKTYDMQGGILPGAIAGIVQG
ncbi:MAG: hypothetical protein NWF08_07855, partial [Candidatus Bathyarchaeota archaeon]|nr:hypothetical protein [Candidatus Bathyarchaeota archaeon]